MSKSKKLRDAARGRECQIRIPGICNFNDETTVLCHYRMQGTCGTGFKPDDEQAAWGCSSCHAAVDGHIKTEYSYDELRLFHAEGVMRTQANLRKEGKL